jgi:hypothetical protein
MTLDFGDYELHEAEDGDRALRLANVIHPDLVIYTLNESSFIILTCHG